MSLHMRNILSGFVIGLAFSQCLVKVLAEFRTAWVRIRHSVGSKAQYIVAFLTDLITTYLKVNERKGYMQETQHTQQTTTRTTQNKDKETT